ncbi:pre-mRNA 3'-end-processing factor FIP1 [Aethina tumida]|uniref:pre-mRNA 3'-end-processing factor FIP1 n=1 Tax=Aethina tumida TaxID=116153 RepID=UPI00096B511A|nr:pre-mRNA 3'-end-processing factor FIP1 [Aethina tumida]
MADEPDNDDQWLYGDNPDGKLPEPETEPRKSPEQPSAEEPPQENEAPTEQSQDEGPPGVEEEDKPEEKEDGEEDGEVKQNGDGSDKDDDEDDSDDDVNVVIGDIKSSAPYTAPVNIKRGGLISSAPLDKTKQIPQQTGKFSVEEFEQIGTINGVPANEYNLDSLEDKPWRKPGADITDYFNYGFNEDTWKAYCERQKRIRVNESGTGLAPMNSIGLPRGPIPIMNDNSKYSGNYLAGPPPRSVPPPLGKPDQQKISTIQVMTADRREYSRKPGFADMSVPPPNFEEFQQEYGFNPEPEPFYGGYEPTQDSQWVVGAPPMGPPPHMMGPPMMPMHSPDRRGRESPTRRESRDRDRESSRSRSEKPRERGERERSHRRERSRSKSRRHRSRSRSPSHRSHRKKKSRRHEDSE